LVEEAAAQVILLALGTILNLAVVVVVDGMPKVLVQRGLQGRGMPEAMLAPQHHMALAEGVLAELAEMHKVGPVAMAV
jgi:hypothetical protein